MVISSLFYVGIISGNPRSFLFQGSLSLDPCGLSLFLYGMVTSAAGGLLLCSRMSILAGILVVGMCDMTIF